MWAPFRGWRLAAWATAVGVIVVSAVGCSSLRYYGQAAAGGASILVERKSVKRLLERTDLDPTERRRLQLAQSIRRFASEELGLPDNRSYRSYVRTGREVVVWNVVAAPELSVEPLRWCFLFAGCVSYRGYFAERRARRYAERLEGKGYDVAVLGAAAYSTLGWFADPLLDTFLGYAEWRLAGLIFHELAHQVVYVKGDTTFNESFATAVEELGVERWLASRGREELLERAETVRREDALWLRLLMRTRACLERSLSSREHDDAWKRRRKAQLYEDLDAQVRALRESGALSSRWDQVSVGSLNNANLASVADYTAWVPAFRSLFEASGGEDFAVFYQSVRRLAQLPGQERELRLAEQVGIRPNENLGTVEIEPICPP